jgi:hypothetical protein
VCRFFACAVSVGISVAFVIYLIVFAGSRVVLYVGARQEVDSARGHEGVDGYYSLAYFLARQFRIVAVREMLKSILLGKLRRSLVL